jgi:hypothetical protein
MAIIFELWAECADPERTRRLAAHFHELRHTLLNGHTITWGAEVALPPAYPYGVRVWSPDLSRSHVRNLQDALEVTEAGLRLYVHLKAAPEFCFARVAWEAENIPMAELRDYLNVQADGDCHLSLECVVDDALYKSLGSPRFYRPFRDGYWWNPYRGESYQPLYSTDQKELNDLCRQLLPEYFRY